MYRITATIQKPGGGPVEWMRMSKDKLTQEQCARMLSRSKEAGRTAEETVTLTKFKCVGVKPPAKSKR
ncbi:hypothetical protein JT31_21695 [Cedecea neteri]|uniref:DUF1187 domain-containing protein n=1 Tax=Cedecea neteri TaxID=158822 RepID=A0A089Q9F6_9ENTR|nr:DUF1187 family protein [Cedecea neteri]AIR07134.1 hypothetical protein JT31_21695 [Cedecea neteri]